MCEKKEKKYKKTRREIILSLLDGEKKIQRDMAKEIGVNDSYISKIVKPMKRDGIVEIYQGDSPKEYEDKRSKKGKVTKREYMVKFCSLNPTVKALSKIVNMVAWDALRDSTFYKTMIPKLIDHFNEKLKAQGLSELTERERACFEEYGLKYSPSFLMLVIDDKRDYGEILEGKSLMFRKNITEMISSPYFEELYTKTIDRLINGKHLNPPVIKLLKDAKKFTEEIIATARGCRFEDVVQATWMIIVSGLIELDMVTDRTEKDDHFWELHGRYYPLALEFYEKSAEVVAEEEATE